MKHLPLRWIIAANAVLLATTVSGAPNAFAAPAVSPPAAGVMASYNGHHIDLADSWGDAQACWTNGTSTDCYDTPAEMTAAHPATPAANALTGAAVQDSPGTCPLVGTVLYGTTNYGVPELEISATGEWVDLAGLGFDDMTQSYIIGDCDTTFADEADGGGNLYPTDDTLAFDASPQMISGWSDAVSSVFLTPAP